MRSLEDLQSAACAELDVTVVRSLKSGGQKKVLLVDQHGESRVLKLIQVGASDPTALERAHREFDLLARTAHPNIVEVRSTLIMLKAEGAQVDGVSWLEECLDGEDLSELLGAPWSADDVRALGLAVASGVGALHKQGVIHRDLSANNVRQLANGEYKVMDPGFAKHTLRSGITVGGQPGTRGFMTPEHLQAYSGPTPASDVFAIGSLMYAAAAGVLPIPYLGDDAEYIQRLGAATHTPLATVRPDLPPPMTQIIERCLHPHPVRRYRNGDRLREALETK